MTKGFSESFDKPVYPPTILDIGKVIPELYNKVEIQPSSESIDPATGIVKLRWDMFVLGTNRMCLGTSVHTSVIDIQRAVNGDPGPAVTLAESKHNPHEIIKFILETLSTSKSGFEAMPAGMQPPTMAPNLPTNRPSIGPAVAGAFYEKSR